MEHIVVVGGGQAGASLVAKLRTLGHEGAITLVAEEPVVPYQRPPLSKAYLLGEMERERLFLRPGKFYEETGVDLRLGTRVTAIDRAARQVVMGDATLGYDTLALTIGLPARRLPAAIGGDLAGVHVIKTLADIDAMAARFAAAARVLIVGGGYIGLEVAAVAAQKGKAVTLVEISERILSRVASPETSDYFRDLHAAHGVDLREGVGLAHLLGEGEVTGAVLTDGSAIEADLVVAGIGLDPDVSLAAEAGLTVAGGIVTDIHGQTSDPRIWAAGDCAVFPHKGEMLRLESVQNAIDMAETVAENILGAGKPYDPVPWFWSDQYDIKLQIAGLNRGYEGIVTRTGTEGGRSLWYYHGGALISVDAMNAPRDYMVGKRLIEMGKTPDPDQVADPDLNLKTLLR